MELLETFKYYFTHKLTIMSALLDLTDKKLLFELDMNARSTNAELAKTLKISKQSVQYRIDRLQQRKIIKGFYTAIDLSKIGCLHVRFFMKFKDTTPEIEKEIIDYALNNKKYGWIVTIDGLWDFGGAMILKDYIEIKETTNSLLSKYGAYVENYEISIATRIDHLQNRFLLGTEEGSEFHIGGPQEDVRLDELDKKILLILSQNARQRLSEIAANLDESYKVISYRIKSLLKRGIIKCFRADLDYNAMGYTHYKIFISLKDFTPQKLKQLKAFIKMSPYTIYITEAIGMAELEFEIVMNDYHLFHDFMHQLKTEFASIIKTYNTVVFYRFYQINYLPSL